MSNPIPKSNPAPKAGWRTSEFWLAVVALLVAAVVGSGVVPESGWAAQVVGLIAGTLTSLGYTGQRLIVKTAAAKGSDGN